ncbi:condensin subunit ScpA [Pelagirhabdus alkalitolerans]|uniref:Segregation and condensation protein A n=1 Tax=Pelagirhabdus alkalitolerans TaxID=1612202 RepID=A0A1G6HBL6_9BACI|nr:segregation/condensation protein A [Pelagirhabdus alkalitolerans]SDB91679.1 condensin subunit ScpA [Pelagirhabdus alkalitolerans]
MQEAYKVILDEFEGPLDLLLHLINQYEIDIHDIPLTKITDQYMEYIHTMQELELDMASEYLVMAATLLAMKSAMLLPNQELDEEDEYTEEVDPREELMARLIEYRKYKEAAGELQTRENQDVSSFTREPEKLLETETKNPVEQSKDVTLYDMLAAVQKVFDRKKFTRPMTTTVEKTDIPISKRMDEILEEVNRNAYGIRFEQLFPYQSKSHIVITFMAVLELMKDNLIYCQQERTFDELILFRWSE